MTQSFEIIPLLMHSLINKSPVATCVYANGEGPDQLGHPRSLTRAFRVCLQNQCIKPYFYTVKLGFTGVYIIFLISAQNIDCGYSLEPPRRGGFNEYVQSMF